MIPQPKAKTIEILPNTITHPFERIDTHKIYFNGKTTYTR